MDGGVGLGNAWVNVDFASLGETIGFTVGGAEEANVIGYLGIGFVEDNEIFRSVLPSAS